MDLQWEMRSNYNARLCAGLRKSAGARTMENNGKNNAQSNRNRRKSVPSGCVPGRKIRKKEQADYRTPWRRNTGKVIEATSKLARHPNRREIQENRACAEPDLHKKQPAAEGRRARISVTRISAIAQAAAQCT